MLFRSHQFSNIGWPCGRIGLFGGGHARRLRCWPVANQWVMPASTRRDSAGASPEGEDRPVDDRFRLAGSDSVVTVASNRCVAESESAQPIARLPAQGPVPAVAPRQKVRANPQWRFCIAAASIRARCQRDTARACGPHVAGRFFATSPKRLRFSRETAKNVNSPVRRTQADLSGVIRPAEDACFPEGRFQRT